MSPLKIMYGDYSFLTKNIRFAAREQFPVKLCALLELAALGETAASTSVAWLEHGRGFRILDEQVFIEQAAPLFFKQSKIRSFYRQLNLWGYKRLTKGPDAGAWYDDHFLRGLPEKMKEMIRVKIKGPKPLYLDQEPDFYRMTFLPRSATPSPMVLQRLLRKLDAAFTRRVSVQDDASASKSDRKQTRLPRYQEEQQMHLEPTLSRRVSESCAKELERIEQTVMSRGASSPYQSPLDIELDHFNRERSSFQPRPEYHVSSLPRGSPYAPYEQQYESTHQESISPVGVSSSSFQHYGEDMHTRATAGLEPLPFKTEAPSIDDFAKFINNVIQIV